MSTYRELTYMVLDKLKESTDDAYFKPEHVEFLLDKYRAFLLKQRYSDSRKEVALANYSIFAINIETLTDNVSTIPNTSPFTVNGNMAKSYEKVPSIIQLGGSPIPVKLYNDFTAQSDLIFKGEFQYSTPDRIKYTGENKWLKKFIYYTLGPDNHIYLKWSDSTITFNYSTSVLLCLAIVENPKDLIIDEYNTELNYLDREYPLEEALVPPLLELVVKDLTDGTYRPEDTVNNATDDLAKSATKVAQQR